MDTEDGRNLMRWTAQVQKENDDYFLVFPQEVLDQLDWHPGDVLQWTDQGDGSWILKKKESKSTPSENEDF